MGDAGADRDLGFRIPSARREEERRVITALFVDLADSTSLGERLDAEALRVIMAAYLDAVSDQIRRYDGQVEKYIGDAVVAVFGIPIARENDAARALHAALAIRDAVARLNRRVAEEAGSELRVRIGINTGWVVAGDLAGQPLDTYLVTGDAMNTAQRLEAAARPGEILVGAATQELVGTIFEFGEHLPVAAKGKRQPIEARSLVGALPKASDIRPKVASPLIGRAPELDRILSMCSRAEKGRGGVAVLVGEAGIGKSRLLAEAAQGVRGVRWLEGKAVSLSRQTMYFPFRQVVHQDLGVADDNGGGLAAQLRMRSRVLLTVPEADQTALYISALLGLTGPDGESGDGPYPDADEMGRQILRAGRRYMRALAEERPTVLCFEDWHWADEASAALLDHILPLANRSPLVIIVAGRPDRESPMRSLMRNSDDGRVIIELDALAPVESQQLLGNLLGQSEVPESIARTVLERTEGNPFFLEEVVRSLIDHGFLVADTSFRGWHLARDRGELAIPGSIEAVVSARIDLLAPAPKDALRIASVIGRDFSMSLLRAVNPNDDADAALRTLEELEFIRPGVLGDRYTFTHALVQQAAYEGMLVSRRRQLHELVAYELERHAARVEDVSTVLAYHFTRAENWAKAQEYLFVAGDQAANVAADNEALSHYRQALDAYRLAFGDRLDALQRAALTRKMGEALFRRGEHTAAVDQLYAALSDLRVSYPRTIWGIRLRLVGELLRQASHRTCPWIYEHRAGRGPDSGEQLRVRILETLAWTDYFRSENERLVLDCVTALNHAERNGDLRAVALSSVGMGVAAMVIPLPRVSRWYYERCRAIGNETEDPIAIGYGHMGLGILDHWHVGSRDAAIAHYEASRTAFMRAGEVRRWGSPSFMLGWLHLGRDLQAALAVARELLTAGEDGADPQLTSWGLALAGRHAACVGDVREAERQLAAASKHAAEVPDYLSLVAAWGDLGSCLLEQDRVPEAIDLLTEAVAVLRQRRLRTPWAARALQSLAAAHLAVAELTTGRERTSALSRANRALLGNAGLDKIDRPGIPRTYRLRGTHAWLRGDEREAKEWWRRSIAAAVHTGDLYEEARTRFELAARLSDEASREAAMRLWADLRIPASQTPSGSARSL